MSAPPHDIARVAPLAGCSHYEDIRDCVNCYPAVLERRVIAARDERDAAIQAMAAARRKEQDAVSALGVEQMRVAELEHVLRNQIHKHCRKLPPSQCVYRPGGTGGWVACCAARKAGVR